MATRRYVRTAPRIRAVANADLDVIVTLREAVPIDSIDEVTATQPNLGDPIDLTGFTNLKGQIRATKQTGSANLVDFTGDDTPRATLSVVIYGNATNGQLRVRTTASRLWAMQQRRVTGAVFDLLGTDPTGIVWALIVDGAFELLHGTTPPFTASSTSPTTAPPDRYSAPINLDQLGSSSSSSGSGSGSGSGSSTVSVTYETVEAAGAVMKAHYLAGTLLFAYADGAPLPIDTTVFRDLLGIVDPVDMTGPEIILALGTGLLAEQTGTVTGLGNGAIVPVDVRAGVATVNPPPSVPGNRFTVIDSRGQSSVNNITVPFGAALFHSLNQSFIINQNEAVMEFLYVDSTIGWTKAR